MPSSDEEIPLIEKCARYKMELIESSNNSRKMVVKKIPIIFPSSPQSSPKRDRLTRKSQIQKFIVDLPVEKEQSNLSKDTEVVKSVEKPKRKSLDLKLKTNDISDMLNVDDGDDDIDTIELSDEEDAGEQRESKSKKKSEEKSRKTPMKDKAAVEEKDKGKSREVTAKLDAWLARIATMPLEKVDNKPSRRWENSAKKEAWVAHIECNSDSELSSTSIKMKITRKPEARGSSFQSPVAGTPRKTASSATKSVKRKLYRIDEVTDGKVLDIESPVAETPQKEISTGNSVTKSARRKLYTIEQTPEEKRLLLFHHLPSREGCPVHVKSHHNQLDTSSPRGSPRVKQCNLAKIAKTCIEDKLVNEVHEEDSEDDSSVVLSSRKQTTSNNDITKSAKRKLYNIDQVEDGKYGQKKKPVVVVEDCMSKVRTRQSSVVKSSNVNKIKPSSTRGGSTPSKRSSKKTVMSESDSDDESESDDESDSYTLWTPDGDTAVRRSGRKRKFVKVSTYDGETSSDASDSVKSSSRSRRRQKRKSTSSDEEKLQRTPSSQHSSSNVTVKDKKQGSGHQGRLLPVNESIQGSGSEVSAAFRRVTLARHSPHEKKQIRYNEDDSENDSDPSESSKSLQHKSRVESCGDEGQSLNLQKSPKFYRGKEDSDSRKGCVNEVLATLRKNIAEKLESPTRHLSRIKETLKHTPSSRRNTSENSDSTIRRSARKHKRINYNLGKDENDSDSDDTTTSQDNQKRGHEFSSSDGGDEMAAISKKSSRPNSKDLIGREKSPRNKESNKKLKTKVSTPSRATTSNYSSPSRLSRRGRIKIGESDSSDSEDNAKNLRSPHDQNFDSTVRRSARENKSMNHNIDKGENVSDSDDTTTSDNNQKRGHEFSSSDGGDEMAAISKKASTRPNTKNLIGSEKSLKNKESDKKSKSGVSTPSKATTSNYDIPPGSSRHGKKTVKISKSDSSDSEDNTKNLKSPNSKLRLNNDSADNNTSPARQSTRKRKPNKRYVDDDKEGGSNSFSVVSSKSFRVPSAKGNENEELRGLRKIVGEKLLSLIQGSTCRKSNADTEGTKSPGNHKRKPAVSSSDDEERAGSRISQSKLQGTPSSKRELSEPSHNASPREKALRNKENCETTTDSKTPSKNYQSPVRHSTRERKPVNINESDPNDNENNTRVSRTKTQKTPDVKQGLNNDAVSGITPSSRSTRKRKPPKKYSDDDEEGNNSSSVVSPRRVQTPQAKRLQADVYASPARRSSQKQTPAKQTSDDSDADVLVSKTESPRTPRAGHLTPLNRKSLARRGLLTPTMPARDRTVSTPNTPQEEAMSRLHVSAVPKTLPCREKEFADIFRFIEGKILDKAGGCMYISGTPGTGKTATVREVMESLRQAVLRKDLPDFQFIEMNAMGLTEPRQAYVFILKALTGEKATAEQAQRTLEKMFTRSAKRKANKSIVLMVDELDILWTKREDVVYNLLDWPTKVGSRLIVLTIANTMDMPERMLKGRVTSRLGLTRLTFQPYTFRQLEQIVQSRLEGIQAFDADAVQLVARKVASVSGDARRALDICRRATELAELDGPDVLVSISHVDVAVREMLSSSKLQALRACSEVELLFLKAVMTEVERTGIEETRFFKVYKMLGALCVLDGLEVPNVSLAMKACNSLGSMRLLLTEHSRSDIQQRLLLNVNPEDVRYTLKEMGG